MINRVGWDGAIRPPEDNELGWKETVRMNPLEDAFVALQPKTQIGLPFTVPLSSRVLDTTSASGAPITLIDPFGTLGGGNPGNATTLANDPRDFGWEYVWHCHILGHEENDFMRPFIMLVPIIVPSAPTGFTAAPSVAGNAVQLTWTDSTPLSVDSNSPDRNAKIGFRIERCTDAGSGCTDFSPISKVPASCTLPPPQATLPPGWPCSYNPPWVNYSYIDSLVRPGATYQYRTVAYNEVGDSTAATSPAFVPGVSPAVTVSLTPGQPSPHLAGTAVKFTAAVTNPAPPSSGYQYRFWLTVEAGSPSIVQDYSYTDNWSLPASTLQGIYTVTVDVRSNLASTTPDASAFVLYQVILPPITGAGVVLNMRMGTTYATITQALADAGLATGDVIETMGTLFYSEPGNAVNINLAPAVSAVTLSGGWDAIFSTDPYMTTLQGSLTVTSGTTLTVQYLVIR